MFGKNKGTYTTNFIRNHGIPDHTQEDIAYPQIVAINTPCNAWDCSQTQLTYFHYYLVFQCDLKAMVILVYSSQKETCGGNNLVITWILPKYILMQLYLENQEQEKEKKARGRSVFYAYVKIFDNLPRNRCFVLAIICAREHSIIKRTHISLTSLKTRKTICIPTNRGTSERSETLAQEGSTRRIRFCGDCFCSGVIWKVILKKRPKMVHTNIVSADLDSPRRELSVRGHGFVVALPVFWGINFVCAYLYWNSNSAVARKGSVAL